ncbi:MAG: hypothetical protein WCY29_16040 [Novosphingobium sp.]
MARHPTHAIPPSPEDWRAGDIAECINTRGWFKAGVAPTPGPVCGELYRVAEVKHGSCGCEACRRRPYLSFSAFAGEYWDAAGFRKITPRADAAERAEVDVLARWLPKKEAA